MTKARSPTRSRSSYRARRDHRLASADISWWHGGATLVVRWSWAWWKAFSAGVGSIVAAAASCPRKSHCRTRAASAQRQGTFQHLQKPREACQIPASHEPAELYVLESGEARSLLSRVQPAERCPGDPVPARAAHGEIQGESVGLAGFPGQDCG